MSHGAPGVHSNRIRRFESARRSVVLSGDDRAGPAHCRKGIGLSAKRAARGLRLGTYQTAGLLVEDVTNPHYMNFAGALRRVLVARSYSLMIEDAELSLHATASLLRIWRDRTSTDFSSWPL